MRKSFEERFRNNVEVREENECWPWKASTARDGYGHIWRKDRLIQSHRFAYEEVHGPIPDGMFVLHSCDNPPCCNPAHLWVGTKKENALDRERKGRGRDSRGLCNAAAKLTEEQVIGSMARLLTGRETATEIARSLGVACETISAIWRGKTWKHLFQEEL